MPADVIDATTPQPSPDGGPRPAVTAGRAGASGDAGNTRTAATTAPKEWVDWRAAREATLAEEHGWLSLTGFTWLASEPSPVPGLPGLWWTDENGAHVRAPEDAGLAIAPGAVREAIRTTASADVPESGSLNWVWDGDRVVELLRRGGRLAVRIRDPHAPTRLGFEGVPVWDHDEAWVLTATFTAHDAPVPVPVGTARDDLVQQAHVVGTVDLDVAGVRHRLNAVAAGDGLALLFHDPTNDLTSAPWRIVVTEAPDEESRVVVDFNRAVNLPFAFTDHGTCPAPVAGNRIALPVTAGEQRPS